MSEATINPAGGDETAELTSRLQRDGWIVFDQLVDPETLRRARTELESQLGDLATADWGQERAVKVSGTGRYMAPLQITGALADPDIFANPAVLAIARAALGKDAILESFGAVTALPGASRQPLHRDVSLLFEHQIGGLVPTYALTFVIPLVQAGPSVGSTAFVTGSHRWLDRHREDEVGDVAYPPLGGAMMWDFRTIHGGTANHSTEARPFLFITYARPWWRDHANYRGFRRRRLQISPQTISALAPDLQTLFVHLVDG